VLRRSNVTARRREERGGKKGREEEGEREGAKSERDLDPERAFATETLCTCARVHVHVCVCPSQSLVLGSDREILLKVKGRSLKNSVFHRGIHRWIGVVFN
jgi:hypothetical protein